MSLKMKSVISLSVLVAVLAVCHSAPTFIPSGKELIYEYNAMINVGTYKPATFASQLAFTAKLHVQKNEENKVMMKFSDMSFKMYNGKMDHIELQSESQALPIPEKAEDLMKPFEIIYDEHGKIKAMIADKSDKKFSRDIKRALASIWQLDMSQIKMDAKEPYTFVDHEDSIYGKDQLMHFEVIPEEMLVDKMVSPNTRYYRGSLDNEELKTLKDHEPMTSAAIKSYYFAKNDDGYCIKKITCAGNTHVHLMRGFSDAFFMLTKQKIILLENKSVETKLEMPQDVIEECITMKSGFSPDREEITDFTMGRENLSKEEYLKITYEMFDKILNLMKMDHLSMEAPDLKLGQSPYFMQRLLSTLNYKELNDVFEMLRQKTNEERQKKMAIFLETLPYVGTRASVLFIHNLVKEGRVEEKFAITMLQQMPFNLRMMCEKLLTDVEDMINMENVSPEVKKVATLSFANMINKVYVHVFNKTEESNCEKLDQYILKYMDLLKNANDYSSQYLYMNALHNIRIGNVYKYLKPYITGEATQNRHLRYLAMCSAYGGAIKDRSYVYEVYWPLFTESTTPFEIRAGAYFTLMGTKPHRGKLMTMYWVLKSESCPELYHLHYTFLRSMMYTTNPIFKGYKVIASEMLNYMRKPYYHPMSGMYIMDYKAPNYEYGATSIFNVISTNTSKSMYIQYNSDMYNIPLTHVGLWLKIDGMDPSIIKKTQAPFETKSVMIEELSRLFVSLKDQKNLHIEYAITYKGKIILMDNGDHMTLNKLMTDLMSTMTMSPIDISFIEYYQDLLPNDLGLPSKIDISLPVITMNKVEMINDKSDETTIKSFDVKHVKAAHAKYGLLFYNPFIDAMHGVQRMQANDVIASMNFKLSMSKDFKLKLTMNKMNDDTTDKFAIRNYGTTVTLVKKDFEGYLQKSSKNSPYYAKVSAGDEYRKSKMLVEHECPFTGLMLQVGVFDSEHHISRKTTMEALQDFSQRYLKNYQTVPMGKMFLTMQQMMLHSHLAPKIGTFGMLIRITPSKKYPVDHLDMSLRFNHEHILEKDAHLPNDKMNGGITWSAKDKDNKVLRSWDMNAILDMNPGHTLNNFKIHFSMMNPEEKEFKMCVTGMRKWLNNKMIGHLNMTMGLTDDSKSCVDNEGLIEIDMTGEMSNEQKELMSKKMTYSECMPEHMHENLMKDKHIKYHQDVDCTMKHTSLRRFEYDIKTSKLSESIKEKMMKMWECMKGMWHYYYISEKVPTEMDGYSMKIVTKYPLIGDEVNMKMITKDKTYKFKEMPNTMWKMFGFHPENYHYTQLFKEFYKMGMIESCIIADEHIYNTNFDVMPIIEKEWMKIAMNNPDLPCNHTLDIFVKKLDNPKTMGLRVKIDEKELEILPEGESYKIVWNGEPIDLTKGSYVDKELFSIGMLNDKYNTIVLHLYKYKKYIDFTGEQIRMDKFKMDMHVTGLCFAN